MSYNNAFNCQDCPKNDSCPCWWEIPWENESTGEINMRKGCILSPEIGLPILQVLIRAVHTASEQSSKVNNNLVNGLMDIGNILITELPKQIGYNNVKTEQDAAETDSKKVELPG